MHSQMVTTLTQESIDKFRSSLYAQGRSEKTAKGYASDLQMMLLEIEEPSISMEEFEETAMNWLTANRRRIAPKTTGRRLTSLRAFAEWAGWGKVLEKYRAPIPPKANPHPLPEGIEGVRRLLRATSNERQRALIALCGLCGLRIAEALACRASWFDVESMVITVVGKGEKTRRVPISPEAWDVLHKPVIRAFVNGDAEVVGLKDRFARRIITDLGVKASLRRRISSQDLRATFATAVYDKTLNIRLAQELLGHSSVETTQIYTGVKEAAMREAVQL